MLKAFESKMPELGGGELGTDFAAVEGGLALALRDATHGERPAPSVGLVTRIGPPPEARAADWPSMPPNATLEESPTVRGEISPTPGAPEEPESRRPRPLSVPASARVSARAESASGLSFAELWPDGEREAARDVERALASHRYADAIELCEKLVSRIFASAAGVLGTTEAPREPALVPMLLGLDGRRFLTFRALVRDARSGGLVSARTALSAYAFAIDARLARSTIG